MCMSSFTYFTLHCACCDGSTASQPSSQWAWHTQEQGLHHTTGGRFQMGIDFFPYNSTVSKLDFRSYMLMQLCIVCVYVDPAQAQLRYVYTRERNRISPNNFSVKWQIDRIRIRKKYIHQGVPNHSTVHKN